ncbi:MAG: hypothetical protein FWC65_04060 [Treponema sp.]|nr:hypothetical protein [Treponema sp.]
MPVNPLLVVRKDRPTLNDYMVIGLSMEQTNDFLTSFIKPRNSKPFRDFFDNLLMDEQRLIDRRKRLEESMGKQNKKKVPVVDVNGRYHAPCDGYQWSDGISTKSFLGGEYLPVDDFTNENNYYRLSKETVQEIRDIPYSIVKEMVEIGLSQEKSVIQIKRHEQNTAHLNKWGKKVITCEVVTSKWHFEHFAKFISYHTMPFLVRRFKK